MTDAGPWRLLYKNSSNNNEVIAELTGDASQSSIKQARWKTRNRGLDKLSIVADQSLFKSVPREENNDFGTKEPGIFWQSQRFEKQITAVDAPSDTFKVAGDVTDDFEEGGAVTVTDSSRTDDGTIFKVKDPSDVSFDSSNNETTITVVEDVTDSTVDGSLEGYENIFRGYPTSQGKITENGDVKLTLAEIRFEPVGFGGSIDTIDSPAVGQTSNTRGNWKEWTAGDTGVANVVNVARVVNSKNGNRFDSGVITNSTSVNKFGKQTPKAGLPVKKSFVDSDKEAKRVAENLIRDSQNPTEGGRVKVAGRFTNNVSNSSFTLNDPVRDLNGKDATPEDVFVCWSQVNFYPENKSILEFQFENQDEREADITDDVRAERSTTFSSSTESVTGETGSAAPGVGGDTGSNAPDVAGQTGDESPDVSGTSDGDGGASVVEEADRSNTTTGAATGYNTGVSFSTDSDDTAGMMVSITFRNGSTTAEGMNIRVEDDLGTTFPSNNGVFSEIFTTNDNEVVGTATIFVPENTSFRDYDVQFELVNNTSSEVGWFNTVQYYTIDQHDHGSGSYDADLHPHTDGTLDTDNHPHTDGTLDTDNHPHQNGNLEANQTGENKTDR